jgi:adenosylcobinamide kinase/adenosylcobinamide-phosphate guanylyltransferase
MITLVLGGARSGKSRLAERLAERSAAATGAPVTYVATAQVRDDPEFDERVRLHRQRRPPSWATAEPGAALVGWVGEAPGGDTLLVDSLGTWVACVDDFAADGAGLGRALAARPGASIVVSEEVGLGVHPSTALGGRFRDALGEVNAAVADVADTVLLVVAGRALRLERFSELDGWGS